MIAAEFPKQNDNCPPIFPTMPNVFTILSMFFPSISLIFVPKKVPHFHPFFVPALSFSSPRTWLKRRPFRFSLPSCRAGKGQNDGFMDKIDKMVDKMGEMVIEMSTEYDEMMGKSHLQ